MPTVIFVFDRELLKINAKRTDSCNRVRIFGMKPKSGTSYWLNVFCHLAKNSSEAKRTKFISRGKSSIFGVHFLHMFHKMFIDEIGPSGFHFVAPCPHEGRCPLAVTGRDWCHFGQRMMRQVPFEVFSSNMSKAKSVQEEKFSYLVVRKRPGPRFLLKREENCETAEERSHFWPRLTMPAIKSGGHALFDVCARSDEGTGCDSGERGDSNPALSMSGGGDFLRLTTSRSGAHALGHQEARRLKWGDLFRFPMRVARPEARPYIGEETRRHLNRVEYSLPSVAIIVASNTTLA